MSRPLTVELSDSTFAALERRARQAAQSPADLAAQTLEQRFMGKQEAATDPETQDARARFERHFGEIDLGSPTGADNEAIDADLARASRDDHEGS